MSGCCCSLQSLPSDASQHCSSITPLLECISSPLVIALCLRVRFLCFCLPVICVRASAAAPLDSARTAAASRIQSSNEIEQKGAHMRMTSDEDRGRCQELRLAIAAGLLRCLSAAAAMALNGARRRRSIGDADAAKRMSACRDARCNVMHGKCLLLAILKREAAEAGMASVAEFSGGLIACAPR